MRGKSRAGVGLSSGVDEVEIDGAREELQVSLCAIKLDTNCQEDTSTWCT